MNETNRSVIILLASLAIILMAVVIFAAWTADEEVVGRLDDLVQYLDDHRDNPGRLILTLGALVVAVLALLVIVVELAPETETREIRVEQAGMTTIVPTEALRLRLEEALVALPQVTAAKVQVFPRDKGVGTALDLTIVPGTNVAAATQEASRVVADTLQTDLGLPPAGQPTVRIVFGGLKERPSTPSPAPTFVERGGPASPPQSRPPEEPPGDAPRL